jgi:hypothetical protein
VHADVALELGEPDPDRRLRSGPELGRVKFAGVDSPAHGARMQAQSSRGLANGDERFDRTAHGHGVLQGAGTTDARRGGEGLFRR